MIRTLISLAFAVTLSGCATPYTGEMGLMGGVEAQPVTSDVYRIVARGNGYTGNTRIQDFVLLKSAETTLAAGKTHFIFGGSSDASSLGSITTPGSFHATRSGNTVFGSYTASTTETYVRPGSDAYIQVITVSGGQTPPPGAFDAAEIVRAISPRLRR